MKKQVKKFSKKIMVLVLATSIIFTTCFSYKKINAHATGAVAALGAYTLYEICLYIGGLAVTTLGIGYAYENRDEIAEFGKSVIDTMSDLPALGWVLGSHTTEGDYVYGTEALKEVQNTAWSVIQGGGNSPKNDNDGDGDKDKDDINHTINLNGYFLLEKGVELFQNHIKPIYDKWANKEEDSIIPYGLYCLDSDYTGNHLNSDGLYEYYFNFYLDGVNYNRTYLSDRPVVACYKLNALNTEYYFNISASPKSTTAGYYIDGVFQSRYYTYYLPITKLASKSLYLKTNLPIVSFEDKEEYSQTGIFPSSDAILNKKTFYVADWIAENEYWKGHLEDIATSLRSLQDLTAIAQALSEGALTTQPSADEYGDMMVNLGNEYAPKTDPVTDPVYWPATNPTPTLDPSVFPNYQPSVNPDPGTNPDSPGDDSGGDTPEDTEIDLDGLLSLFNILFYLIMIIIMLIYLFLACLAFIVMIFRIPASSAMLPEDMVLGFEHLKTIMIPGMNISIYGFAMALIYMFIIFAVIRALRLEINDFKIPRSFKK